MTSSDAVKPSVLDSPSAVLAGPSNGSKLLQQQLDASTTNNLMKYGLIAAAIGAAVFLVSKFSKK